MKPCKKFANDARKDVFICKFTNKNSAFSSIIGSGKFQAIVKDIMFRNTSASGLYSDWQCVTQTKHWTHP